MSNLEEARQRWLLNKPHYDEYGRILKSRLEAALRRSGIWFEVTFRAKTVESLVKKLIRKPTHSYGTVPDKLGIRVIVRYRSDLNVALEAILELFHCGNVDRKLSGLDTVGYSNIHVDTVRLRDTDPEQRRFPAESFWAELQLRTQAQHLWSEMSHDNIYKNEETIATLPDDIKRRVNLMAGQVEIADREFDRLASETRLPGEVGMLRFLEPFYYRLTSAKPDVELSLVILGVLIPTYRKEIGEIENDLRTFLKSKENFLERRYAQAQAPGATPVSPLFFQPEALMIYERLSYDEIGLRQAWRAQLPLRELKELALDLGFSFE